MTTAVSSTAPSPSKAAVEVGLVEARPMMTSRAIRLSAGRASVACQLIASLTSEPTSGAVEPTTASEAVTKPIERAEFVRLIAMEVRPAVPSAWSAQPMMTAGSSGTVSTRRAPSSTSAPQALSAARAPRCRSRPVIRGVPTAMPQPKAVTPQVTVPVVVDRSRAMSSRTSAGPAMPNESGPAISPSQ